MENLPVLNYDTILELNSGYSSAIIKTGETLRSHGIDAPHVSYLMARCKSHLIDHFKKEGYVGLAKYKNRNGDDGILIGMPMVRKEEN